MLCWTIPRITYQGFLNIYNNQTNNVKKKNCFTASLFLHVPVNTQAKNRTKKGEKIGHQYVVNM